MKLASAMGNGLWLAASVRGASAMRRAMAGFEELQRHRLAEYLGANADTEFGRTHEFGRLRKAEDYCLAVPISDYAGHKPYIDRIADGAKGVLTAEPVVHFGLTAGTGGPAKLIPYTESLKREFNCAIAPWVTDVFIANPNLMAGSAYWSISPALGRRRTKAGIPVGFEEDTAYLGGLRKRFIDSVMAVPGEVSRITDVQDFRRITALGLLAHADLRLISVWHPGFLLLLWDWIESEWTALLEQMSSGIEHRDSGVVLAPNPRRAKRLAALGTPEPKKIWPRLGLISCWADGFARNSAATLSERFPGVAIQPKGVIASEAFVTIPLRGTYPLAATSHVFEFLSENNDLLWPWELEMGQRVSPVVTTAGGLYRYRIDDLFDVTGFLGQVPCLRFLSKSSVISDLCGEKLEEAFVMRVLSELFGRESVSPHFAMLAPSLEGGTAHYVLFIDAVVQDDQIARSLEGALSENPHFELCRRLGQLGPTKVTQVGPRAFDTYLTRLASEKGQRLGDIKPLALSTLTGWEGHFPSPLASGSELSPSSEQATCPSLDF